MSAVIRSWYGVCGNAYLRECVCDEGRSTGRCVVSMYIQVLIAAVKRLPSDLCEALYY